MRLNADEYVAERLMPEIEYYERRAAGSKRLFRGVSVLAIIASAAIPVAATADVDRWVLAGLGSLVAASVSSLALFRWQEDWLQFRGNAEALKKEQAHFDTRTGPYRDLDSEDLAEELVLRVEGLISQEHQVWQRAQRERGS